MNLNIILPSDYNKDAASHFSWDLRAPDKMRIFISIMKISSVNPMFDHLLESSHRDGSNKWSNIGFAEKISKVEPIEVHFINLIWSSGTCKVKALQTFFSIQNSADT